MSMSRGEDRMAQLMGSEMSWSSLDRNREIVQNNTRKLQGFGEPDLHEIASIVDMLFFCFCTMPKQMLDAIGAGRLNHSSRIDL
jgi:hypothetical protein